MVKGDFAKLEVEQYRNLYHLSTKWREVEFKICTCIHATGRVTLAQLPGDQDESLTINGVEAIYTVFGPHHGDLKVQLVWSSADGSVDYTLTSTKNTAQTKAELEALVTSFTAQ